MQDLITGKAGAVANIPSYAQGASGLGDLGGESFPRLTFKGSRFRVAKGGDEEVLEVTRLKIIVLAANPTVSRIYYKGSYNEDSTGERPTCASADGVVPLESVSDKQNDVCATCPQNQKGSAISDDGGKRKACSYFHRLVVKLVDYPDMEPLVTEIKAMSLFGESYPDSNLLNFRHYADRLNQHQTMAHAVLTEMSFDTDSSVPKVLFQPVGYVPEAEFLATIHPLATDPATIEMASTASIRTGSDGDTAAPGGFRDRLLDAPAPAHASTGTEKDYMPSPEELKLADLQAQIAAMSKPPAPPAPPPVPQLTEAEQKIADLQAQIEAMSKPAPQAAPATELKTGGAQVATQLTGHEKINEHGVAWNPDLHATSSETGEGILNADGHWRARRGLDAGKVALGKVAATTPQVGADEVRDAAPPAEDTSKPDVEGTKFDDDLDAALAEFDN